MHSPGSLQRLRTIAPHTFDTLVSTKASPPAPLLLPSTMDGDGDSNNLSPALLRVRAKLAALAASRQQQSPPQTALSTPRSLASTAAFHTLNGNGGFIEAQQSQSQLPQTQQLPSSRWASASASPLEALYDKSTGVGIMYGGNLSRSSRMRLEEEEEEEEMDDRFNTNLMMRRRKWEMDAIDDSSSVGYDSLHQQELPRLSPHMPLPSLESLAKGDFASLVSFSLFDGRGDHLE